MLPAPFSDRVVKAFHGTTIDKAAQIVKDQLIAPSRNPYDWLGHGAYFWEESYERARQWAEKKYHSEAAVVSTEVRLGRCINLFDASWASVLGRAHEDLRARRAALGQPVPQNRGGRRELDCAIINHIAEDLYEAETIRAAYLEGEAIYPSSLFVGLAHIQLVARTPNAVVARYEVEEGS